MKRQSVKKAKQMRLEKDVKKLVFARSEGLCEACWPRGLPLRPATTKHERIMRSAGGDPLDVENCLAVCNECHTWIHGHPTEATEMGLLSPNSNPSQFRNIQ